MASPPPIPSAADLSATGTQFGHHFDTKTLKTLGQVRTGANPDSIIYDPSSKRIFAFNGGSKNATAIDAASGQVAGTLDLGGRPEFAVSDEKGTVFVNIEDKSEVVAFDPNKLVVKARWSLGPEGEEPSGMAFDRKHDRLFVVCSNREDARPEFRPRQDRRHAADRIGRRCVRFRRQGNARLRIEWRGNA